jgi:hypothetical protein
MEALHSFRPNALLQIILFDFYFAGPQHKPLFLPGTQAHKHTTTEPNIVDLIVAISVLRKGSIASRPGPLIIIEFFLFYSYIVWASG